MIKFYDSEAGYIPYKVTIPTLNRILIFRFFAIIFIGVALNYLWWRWAESINPDALWFSGTLFMAEVLMFIGSLLMIINHWNSKVIYPKRPARLLSQIQELKDNEIDRLISIDVFLATYNEPASLVEKSIIDAKKLEYKFKDVEIRIYMCDDGKRDGRSPDKENFKELAEKHGIHYFVREDNIGFKAGNLNNAFWQTEGDFIVILDADTRVFPNFLNNMMGYFRNPKMAWVQSPQWFYDLPKSITIKKALESSDISFLRAIPRVLPFLNKLRIGKDVFGTDPRIFYNVILFHRNSSNAAFCCGAGSIHRRKTLEHHIVNQSERLEKLESLVPVPDSDILNKELFNRLGKKSIGPFVHHISEDIYTSILIHSDEAKWESYQHPKAECKMLSPQTLPDYAKQFTRYAEGTYSIFFSRDNPLIKKGLTIWQRLAYLETIYSYFSPIWVVIFLLSPIIFYFLLIPPLKAFSFDFFLRLLILNIFSQLLSIIMYWKIESKRSEQYYFAGFWIKTVALLKVLFRKKLTFNTTPKEPGKARLMDSLPHVIPHLIIVLLTIAGFFYNLVLIKENTHPSYSAFFANNIWATYNLYQLSPIVFSAFKTK